MEHENDAESVADRKARMILVVVGLVMALGVGGFIFAMASGIFG